MGRLAIDNTDPNPGITKSTNRSIISIHIKWWCSVSSQVHSHVTGTDEVCAGRSLTSKGQPLSELMAVS